MRAAILALLVVTPVTLFSSCNDKKDSGGGGGGGATEDPSEVMAGTLAVVTGQIKPAEGADLASTVGATVQAEGHPEISAVTDEEGNFTIENVLPGTVSLYVGSNDGETALKLDEGKGIGPTKFGLKIPDVVLKSGEVTDLGEQPLKKTGGISGKVVFYSNPNKLDLTGSEVFVPGTGFIVKTDAAGAFSLSGLPPGKYDIRAQHTGFAVLDIKDVLIVEDTIGDIGNVALSLSTGPEGKIEVVEDDTATIASVAKAKIVKSRKVKLRLTYDSDAALMKVADEPSFTNKEWEPVKGSFDWTFTSDGLKSLYVMYSDLNGLESSPYKDEVYVDTQAPTLTSFAVVNDWVMVGTKFLFFDIDGADTGSGIADIMISETSDDFDDGEVWQPYASHLDYELKNTANGGKLIHIRVRDFAGRVSSPISDDFAKGAHTKVTDTTYEGPLHLQKAQEPYFMTGEPIFKGVVTIDAGVDIDIDDNTNVFFKNKLIAAGTSTAPIKFRNTATNTAILRLDTALPGVSSKTKASHVHFVGLEKVVFNGGEFTKPTFDGTGGARGSNEKRGEDPLLLDQPTFINWASAMTALAGIDATRIKGGGGNVYNLLRHGVPGITPEPSTASGSTVEGGEYTIDDEMINDEHTVHILSGDATIKNVTIHSHSSDFTFYNEGSGDLKVVDSNADSCNLLLLNVGDGKTIMEGGSATGCGYYARNNGPSGSIHVSGATLTGGLAAIADDGNPTYATTFDQNAITVEQGLVQLGNSSSVSTFTDNIVNCVNNGTNGSICDIFSANINTTFNASHAFTLTGNDINCPQSVPLTLSTGCRGFIFNKTEVNAQTMTLTFSLNNNFWGSRELREDFDDTIPNDGFGTNYTAEVRTYVNSANLTLVNLPAMVTNKDSTNNAGP